MRETPGRVSEEVAVVAFEAVAAPEENDAGEEDVLDDSRIDPSLTAEESVAQLPRFLRENVDRTVANGNDEDRERVLSMLRRIPSCCSHPEEGDD